MRFLAIPLLFLAGAGTLAGCAQTIAESRVKRALVNAGVDERGAQCMAGRLVDRLNITQLRKLEALSGVDRTTIGSLTVGEFVRRVERVGDPEVLAVVSTSGIVCAVRG